LRSVSGTGTGRHRGLPAPTGPDRQKYGTDRPGLFYDVFDTHFVLNSPKRYDILKILIKYVIKQPGPVGAGLVLVQSGQGRSVPIGAAAGWCRSGPVPLTDRKKRCKILNEIYFS
jgi:hypothetical protein